MALGTSGDGNRFISGAFGDSIIALREMAYYVYARRR